MPTDKAAMKRWMLALSLLLLVTLPLGCGKKVVREKLIIPKDAASLTISFSWEGIRACDHQSPEIHVADIPADTVRFKVKLTDLTLPEWNQGGGEVANDGSGVIPAGALDVGFNGPCPPPDKRHKYEFLVMALDDQGQIIGAGRAHQIFPPKN